MEENLEKWLKRTIGTHNPKIVLESLSQNEWLEFSKWYANEKVKEALDQFQVNVNSETYDWDKGEGYIELLKL